MAGISATGQAIPAYIILKHDPVEQMVHNDLHGGVRFARSPTGFSNAALTLDWLKHFNRYSFEQSSTFASMGWTFKEWFGVDEYGRDIHGQVREINTISSAIGHKKR